MRVIGLLSVIMLALCTGLLMVARRAEARPAAQLIIEQDTLYRIWRDGSGRRALADLTLSRIRVTVGGNIRLWSPDGRWALYLDKGRLHRVPATGGRPEALTPTSSDARPTFSPDGAWLYYDVQTSLGWDIYRVPLDLSAPPQAITHHSADDIMPIVSPDGGGLVFMSRRARQNWDIFYLPIGHDETQTEPENLTDSPTDEYLIGWGAGEIIYRDAANQIWQLSLDADTLRPIDASDNQAPDLSVSPVIDLPWQPWRLLLFTLVCLVLSVKINGFMSRKETP